MNFIVTNRRLRACTGLEFFGGLWLVRMPELHSSCESYRSFQESILFCETHPILVENCHSQHPASLLALGYKILIIKFWVPLSFDILFITLVVELRLRLRRRQALDLLALLARHPCRPYHPSHHHSCHQPSQDRFPCRQY